MIRQKLTKTITGAYTTTDADNGYRIICSSSSNFTIILHSASGRNNFELEIDNIGTGKVTIGSQVLSQYTHAHIGNNGGTAWSVVVGGGSITKAEIEAVLIGEISSHSHSFNDNVLNGASAPTTSTVGTLGQFYVETTTPKLYYCSTINNGIYTWTEVGSGGEIAEIPQATAEVLGGVKASPRTSSETQEVKIDTATGKLYSTPPTQAQNGLPAGGIIGQVPIKNSNNDYDYSWGNISSGSGIPIGTIYFYPIEAVPTDSKVCNGQVLSKAEYPELYQLIGSTYDALADESIVPAMTGYTTGSWAVTASSSAEPAWKAFDKIIGTTNRWRADTSSGWIKIEKNDGIPFTIKGYSITGNDEANYLNRAPKSWVVKDALGNVVDVRSNEIGWISSQERFYMFENEITTTALLFESMICTQDYLVIIELKLLMQEASETEFTLPNIERLSYTFPCIKVV